MTAAEKIVRQVKPELEAAIAADDRETSIAHLGKAIELLQKATRKLPRKSLAPGRTKAQRADARKVRDAEVRAAVMARADGRCEWCQREGFILEWAHIFEGGERDSRTAIDTTAAACFDCHRRGWHSDKTEKRIRAFNDAKVWAIRLGFRDALHEIEKKLAKVDEARSAARRTA